ncbi:MAG: porin PorA family protein [Candidatus Kerfeldbacteria bacterium]|nr:porin PorA family protein [Candidatus Kerfeldbacteria bacterium]
MKPLKKHILFFGALTFAALIPLWLYVLAPYFLRLPDNFSYSADLVSWDNFYDQTTQSFIGKTQSDSSFSYRTLDARPGVLTIQNAFSVRSSSGEPVFSVLREYAVSPTTQKHVPGFGDHDRAGYLFGPQGVRPGQDFTYWHVNYDVPAEMHYKSTEYIDGLRVFHYQTVLTPDQTVNLQKLPQVGQTFGINLDVALDLWIEPTTGWLVKYADKAVGYYYDLGTQERLYPWNSFSNVFTDDAVAQQVTNARQYRLVAVLMRSVIPWAILFFVVVCILPLLMERFKVLDRIVRRFAPYIVATCGIGLSVFGWFVSSSIINAQKLIAFQDDATEVVEKIAQRMDVYRNILDSAVSVLAAQPSMTADEWQTFIERLNVTTLYPGVESFGFAPYSIHEIDGRKIAMDTARDTGSPTMTGKLIMLSDTGEDARPGFVLYDPVYSERSYTVAERRENLLGFAFATFHMQPFVDEIFGAEQLRVAFDIYDDAMGRTEAGEMYTSMHMDVDSADEDGLLTATRQLFAFGHRWRVGIAELPSTQYRSLFELMLPWVVLSSGIMISLLFSALLYVAERGVLSVRPIRRRHRVQ